MKGFALGLALKQRQNATWKSPILLNFVCSKRAVYHVLFPDVPVTTSCWSAGKTIPGHVHVLLQWNTNWISCSCQQQIRYISYKICLSPKYPDLNSLNLP